MDNMRNYKEPVYTDKVKAGRRRTYFFDVRQTKGDDYYITITESTKRLDGDGYQRHKIFLYKEDFNRFVKSIVGAVDHVKNNLMPDFDYDEFERRQIEWEAKKAAEETSEHFDDAGETGSSQDIGDDTEATEDDLNW